jgi:hypothetical protein
VHKLAKKLSVHALIDIICGINAAAAVVSRQNIKELLVK